MIPYRSLVIGMVLLQVTTLVVLVWLAIQVNTLSTNVTNLTAAVGTDAHVRPATDAFNPMTVFDYLHDFRQQPFGKP